MTAENLDVSAAAPRRARMASMRPRPMTAENLAREGRAAGRDRSFNEAAADDRGKPWMNPPVLYPVVQLQ